MCVHMRVHVHEGASGSIAKLPLRPHPALTNSIVWFPHRPGKKTGTGKGFVYAFRAGSDHVAGDSRVLVIKAGSGPRAHRTLALQIVGEAEETQSRTL